jgi:hypothetical protein
LTELFEVQTSVAGMLVDNANAITLSLSRVMLTAHPLRN